jgi:hypothetical protein
VKPFRSLARCSILFLIAGFVSVFFFARAIAAQTSVITYHNDNHRTGWNPNETILTPAKVNASQFGLLATVAVDDEVDAQPLLVPGVNITVGKFQGKHDVVYVVTANNTVYAVDATSGTVLLSNHLGTPVFQPIGCKNNGPNVGVGSTPVIDVTRQNLYLIAYTQGSSGPVYTVHALNLGSLADTLTPQVVSGSHLLTDGSTYDFNATYQRQRPALLEANGNIYAGFGSFCDMATALSRGWVLGWNAATLAPLAGNQLFQSQATDPDDYFLASVWMSGYGLSADDSGNVLFATGNSDPSGTTYDGVTSIQESVIKLSSDLTTVLDLFTPSDWAALDAIDNEFGSGGVLILPDQPGSVPHMAVAAGKDGNLYFMNEDDLGGYSATTNNVLGTYPIGKCLCGQSYFARNGVGGVVASGGSTINLFEVVTSPKAKLLKLASTTITSGQGDSGFFTSVSSNHSATPIIWAIARPVSSTQPALTLYAFNPFSIKTPLFSAVAGQWKYYRGHYNLPPTIANGKVYVASYQQLEIFGLLAAKTADTKK